MKVSWEKEFEIVFPCGSADQGGHAQYTLVYFSTEIKNQKTPIFLAFLKTTLQPNCDF